MVQGGPLLQGATATPRPERTALPYAAFVAGAGDEGRPRARREATLSSLAAEVVDLATAAPRGGAGAPEAAVSGAPCCLRG